MIAVRFVLFVIPVGVWSVTDNFREPCAMRLTEARKRKANADKRIGEWYLIKGLKKHLRG